MSASSSIKIATGLALTFQMKSTGWGTWLCGRMPAPSTCRILGSIPSTGKMQTSVGIRNCRLLPGMKARLANVTSRAVSAWITPHENHQVRGIISFSVTSEHLKINVHFSATCPYHSGPHLSPQNSHSSAPGPSLSSPVLLKCLSQMSPLSTLLSQFFPSRHPCNRFDACFWSWFILHVAEPEVSVRLSVLSCLCSFLQRKPTVLCFFVHLIICLMQLFGVELGYVLASCYCV